LFRANMASMKMSRSLILFIIADGVSVTRTVEGVTMRRMIVWTCLVLLVGGLGVCGDAAGADAAAKPTVEVCGVRIVGGGYGKTKYGPELRAFNWTPGTTIAVLVQNPGGGLLKLDRKASKLKTLADDKGTNLLKMSKASAFGAPGFGMSSDIGKDGKACMAEFVSEGIPAKGATGIIASGTMVFRCATKKKTFTHKNVALKPGSEIKAGAVVFKIMKADKPKWGKSELEVTLKTNTDISNIAAIRFLDAAGKEIPSKGAGSSTMRMGGRVTVEKGFRFKKKVAVATVAIDYWMDMKTLKVPFDLKATIGL